MNTQIKQIAKSGDKATAVKILQQRKSIEKYIE